MAKSKEPAPPARAVAHVVTLTRPIIENGNEIRSLELVEPELGHLIKAERAGTGSEQSAAMVAELSGISAQTARRVLLRDLRAIERWVDGLKSEASCTFETDARGGARFNLGRPLPTEREPIAVVTLREPDIEAAIAVEKFKHPAEQTAAIIAVLADLTIPIVARLTLADLAVIEAWLVPFVRDTPSREARGAT